MFLPYCCCPNIYGEVEHGLTDVKQSKKQLSVQQQTGGDRFVFRPTVTLPVRIYAHRNTVERSGDALCTANNYHDECHYRMGISAILEGIFIVAFYSRSKIGICHDTLFGHTVNHFSSKA